MVVKSGVISRATVVTAPIKGLILPMNLQVMALNPTQRIKHSARIQPNHSDHKG